MKIYATLVSLALIASLGWSLNAHRQLQDAHQTNADVRGANVSNTDLIIKYRDDIQKLRDAAERTEEALTIANRKNEELEDLFERKSGEWAMAEVERVQTVEAIQLELEALREIRKKDKVLLSTSADALEGKIDENFRAPFTMILRENVK